MAEDNENTVTVSERAAVIGASLLKKNAKAYYKKNMTKSADVLHSMARQLNEGTETEWKELEKVTLHD